MMSTCSQPYCDDWDHLLEGRTLVGPHPSMRFLEYVPGELSDHPLHADTPLLESGSCSDLTVLVYLTDFQGGELELEEVEGEATVTIQPKAGMVVVFPHRSLHRAKAVKNGTKQVLKLSVLYEPEVRDSKNGG